MRKRSTPSAGRVRLLIIFFMIALAVSGLTAIPLQWELFTLNRLLGGQSLVAALWPAFAEWIGRVNSGVQNGYGQYPFLAYGTDWLAFAHVAIAVLFIGPLRDPVKNLWVIEFGMIACILIIPWTAIFAPLRGVPFFWMLIDMAFGVFGLIPLWLLRREILRMSNAP
ncbi:MAG TPA: hypothetical protein VLZ89_16210 [Anaerolineales bacterium]|nr:hypothetical protein [Anaerolineales bacterium]